MGAPFLVWAELIGRGARRGASGPLAHAKSGLFTEFPAKSEEPVVHSEKWTTSSHVIGPFSRFSGQINGASGPLEKVDH